MRLPLVTQDFAAGQSTAYKAVEGAFRFGPRWQVFYPKTGIAVGIAINKVGFLPTLGGSCNLGTRFCP